MKFRISAVALLAMGSLVTVTAWAAKGGSSQVLGTFQLAYPGYETQWHKGEGVADGTKSQQALHMEKVDLTKDTSGSQAVITGADGVTITELGFDVRNDGVCGSAPYFRVMTAGVRHVFECSAGVSSPTPEDPVNWTTIRFPAAMGLTADDLRVIFLLPAGDDGFTHLDNLDVNEMFIGKSGGGNR